MGDDTPIILFSDGRREAMAIRRAIFCLLLAASGVAGRARRGGWHGRRGRG